MKNSYKIQFPTAWADWVGFSQSEEIDFKIFQHWAESKGVLARIIQYPHHYRAEIDLKELSKDDIFTEWFEALDYVADNVFELVEEVTDNIYLEELYEASKELDTKQTSEKGVLKHYETLISEITVVSEEITSRLSEHGKISEDDIDSLDLIIMLSLSCKRLLMT